MSMPPPPPPPPCPAARPHRRPATSRTRRAIVRWPSYASFGARLGGYLLDSILYGLLVAGRSSSPGIVLIQQAYDDCVSFNDEILCPDGSPKPGLLAAAIALFVIGVVLVAIIYCGRSAGPARPGDEDRRRQGDRQGDRPADRRRQGVPAACWSPAWHSSSLCYLGYLWMLWDKDKQTWHDKIVSTVVVRA